MKRFPVEAAIAFAFGLLALAYAVFVMRDRPVLTTGPCTMLGIAELADHPGAPFLVIDCEGYQFGVPAVLP